MNTITQAFGPAAHLTYAHDLIGVGDADRERFIAECELIATAANINMTMTLHGDQLVVAFDNHAEQLIFRNLVSSTTETEVFEHTEGFDDCDDDHRNTWIYEARKALQDAGMPHRFEENGRDAVFQFRSFEALSMFTELRDTGYFDKRAQVQLRLDGPHPSGAIPY